MSHKCYLAAFYLTEAFKKNHTFALKDAFFHPSSLKRAPWKKLYNFFIIFILLYCCEYCKNHKIDNIPIPNLHLFVQS